MKYLVDTHVFLWWMTDKDRLSGRVIDLIKRNPADIAFSSISVWEMAIKATLGKVENAPIDEISSEVEALGWTELPFTIRHVPYVAKLPYYHHDPFDRALIGQAIAEDLTFVTHDKMASSYPARVMW